MATLTRKQEHPHAHQGAWLGALAWMAILAVVLLVAFVWMQNDRTGSVFDPRSRITLPSTSELPSMPNPEPLPSPAPKPLG